MKFAEDPEFTNVVYLNPNQFLHFFLKLFTFFYFFKFIFFFPNNLYISSISDL